MSYQAGINHMNVHLILGSYQHVAAIGALALFLVEGILLGISVFVGRQPQHSASQLKTDT